MSSEYVIGFVAAWALLEGAKLAALAVHYGVIRVEREGATPRF